MKISSIVFLIIVFLIDRVLRKKFPRFYERIQLPINVMLSALAAVYCGFLIYVGYDVLKSSLLNGDKIVFAIFIGVVVSLYAAIVAAVWVRWAKEKAAKNKPEG